MRSWNLETALLGAIAQFERDLISERTRAGLAAARKRGKHLGPPVKRQADMAPKARALLDEGESAGFSRTAVFVRFWRRILSASPGFNEISIPARPLGIRQDSDKGQPFIAARLLI